MQKEILERANKIMNLIKEIECGIKCLQKYDEEKGLMLYAETEHGYGGYSFKNDIHFEPWEVRLMIHNKKQRIQALEKELEQL